MNQIKIYYAHPISMYGSLQEKRDIEQIKSIFPNSIIYNPGSDEESNIGYKKEGMEYFYNKIAFSDILIFRAFPDGKLGAGVVGEINKAKDSKKGILELPILTETRYLSINDTREYLKLCGKR